MMICHANIAPLRAEITPNPIATSVANGTSVNGGNLATIIVTGGHKPYAYSWAENAANLFLSVSNSATPVFLVTGTDVSHVGVASVLATDAAGRTIESSVSFNINQGTPP